MSSPADFKRLRESGVDKKVTVQKVCRDEKDVRVVLDGIWQKPSRVQEILDEAMNRNQEVFEFEKNLASRSDTRARKP